MKRKTDTDKVFKERFSALRLSKELSQAAFSEKVGISRPTVGFYENGDRLPDIDVLRRICDKCNVSADYLLGLTDVATQETELRAVCEYTGLSTDAIAAIRDHRDNPSISAILAMPEFWKLIYCICAVDGELKHLQTRIDQNDIDYFKEPEPDRDMRLRRFDATEALSLLIDEFSGYQEAQKSFGKLIWENFHQRKAKE